RGISYFFFFSSRRRHTRFSRDWSSDVCSSDLASHASLSADRCAGCTPLVVPLCPCGNFTEAPSAIAAIPGQEIDTLAEVIRQPRSEERRVGKECRDRE